MSRHQFVFSYRYQINYIQACCIKEEVSLNSTDGNVVGFIFCSTDTKEERNALMQHVYPKLAEFCREKYGLEFQVSFNNEGKESFRPMMH